MADEDYRGQHEAPGPGYGMPLHDTTDVYPKDFYGPNGFRYYADQGSDYDRNSYNTAVRLNGKPEEPVWIHRAVPLDVYKKAMKTDAPLSHLIKKGDWVTPSKEYAREHGEGPLGGKYKVVGKRVRAKDVFTKGDSIHEWGYHPAEKAEGGEVDETDIPQISNAMSVFPKPERMFPADARPAGGQYIDAATKQDVTGHQASMASVGVLPGGKPFFNVSRDSAEQVGSSGRGTAISRTNLFKQKAGWKWLEAPEGHEDTNTIVSTDHRNKHYYSLNAHYPKGVDLARYPKKKQEPKLRPTTRGNLTLGNQVGRISVRGAEHPVYDHVIMKADGGIVGDPNTDEGITAYHGSPHDFERFDMSKIGTGEGAQAYGHGLYFAESEPIAKSYRNKLAMGQSTLDNRPMGEVASEKHRLPYGTQPTPEHDIADIIDSYGDTARHVMETRHPHLLSHYDKLVSEGRIKEPGHMYEVHINARPDHFLDWNKPLYQQPEHIQKAIHLSIASAKEDAANGPRDMAGLVADGNRKPQRSNPNDYIGHDGAMLQQMLEKVYGAQGSTDILHKNGIKGIRYLDADSRSASKTPTRNYVVFDDKLVNVKRKYAKGGTVRPSTTVEHTGNGIFDVFHGDKKAGTISLARNGEGHFVSAANLDEPFIGKGIGHEAYNLIEQKIGRKIAPSPLGISPTASKFWIKRLKSFSPEERQQLYQTTRQAGSSYGIPERDVNLRLYGIAGSESLPPIEENPNIAKAKGGSVDEYPLDADADEHKHSGGHMTWMSPNSFLDKAQEMRGDKDDKHAIKRFEKRMEHGDTLNPLALYPKGGQDGRHRATAAKHEGIKKIPVVQWPKKADGGSIVQRALMLTSKKA